MELGADLTWSGMHMGVDLQSLLVILGSLFIALWAGYMFRALSRAPVNTCTDQDGPAPNRQTAACRAEQPSQQPTPERPTSATGTGTGNCNTDLAERQVHSMFDDLNLNAQAIPSGSFLTETACLLDNMPEQYVMHSKPGIASAPLFPGTRDSVAGAGGSTGSSAGSSITSAAEMGHPCFLSADCLERRMDASCTDLAALAARLQQAAATPKAGVPVAEDLAFPVLQPASASPLLWPGLSTTSSHNNLTAELLPHVASMEAVAVPTTQTSAASNLHMLPFPLSPAAFTFPCHPGRTAQPAALAEQSRAPCVQHQQLPQLSSDSPLSESLQHQCTGLPVAVKQESTDLSVGVQWQHAEQVRRGKTTASQAIQLVALARVSAYKSNLSAHKVKMCLKTNTDATLASLPPSLGHELQRALCSTVHPGLAVLDMSVRPGCVMITLDLMLMSDSGEASSTGGLPGVLTSQQQKAIIQSALKPLQPLLNKHGKLDLTTAPPQQGRCCAVAQVDHSVMQVLCSGPGTDVGFNTLVTDTATLLGWTLGVATQLLGPAPATTTTAPTAGCITLHVWCLPPNKGKAAGVAVQPLQVTGWSPPATGHDSSFPWHNMSTATVTEGRWRLLARSEGAYVSTVVSVVAHFDNGASLLQVNVDSNELFALCPLHHPGSAHVGVLPVSLELWCGETWCSTTQHLVQISPRTLAAPASTQSQAQRWMQCVLPGVSAQGAWWWGSAAGSMQAALAELQQLCSSASVLQLQLASRRPGQAVGGQAQASAEVLHSHVEFVEDVVLWLNNVRLMAQGASKGCPREVCSTRRAATVLTEPAMSATDLVELAVGLQEHAKAAGMPATASLITQQLQTVVQPGVGLRASSTSSTCSWVRGAAQWWRALTESLVGGQCAECELLYRARLSHQLASVQALSSAIFLAIGFAAYNPGLLLSCSSLHNAAFLPWMGLHAMVCLPHWLPVLWGSRPARTPSQCSWWCVVSYVYRLTIKLGIVFGFLRLMDSTKHHMAHGGWMLAILAGSLGEQMQASVLVPPRAFMVLVLLDAVTYAVLVWEVVHSPAVLWAAASFLLTILPRLLLDRQLRVLLRPRTASVPPWSQPHGGALSGDGHGKLPAQE